MNETIYSVMNEESGIRAEVFRLPAGQYSVVITDLDCGRKLPPVYKPTEYLAKAYADLCVKHS